MPTVAILGATGMLGSVALASFRQSAEFKLVATARDKKELAALRRKYSNVQFHLLDAETADSRAIAAAIASARWVINAIGVIKPYIHDDSAIETERAVRINSWFPYLLAKAARAAKARVIQIATDCVFSGAKGQYVETDLHDALDVYGKTKSLGEVYNNHVYHLRCSIIGPERKAHLSLMDWFLSQPEGAHVNGFTNHHWNGVTTLHFARLCQGIIKQNINLPHLQHVIPASRISKADLLKCFAKEFNRSDITVAAVKAPTVIDRTLATSNKRMNNKIWRAAGYKTPPPIEQMIKELADFGLAKKEPNR